MIITQASAVNFQSYDRLQFSYDALGLCLISGPTGAGKSTLLDLVPWVLYGVTSKDGAADDVRGWDAEGPTVGTIEIQLADGAIRVRRSRGSSNDLYWCEEGSDQEQRGKDLNETQKLLELRLGVSAELFLLGSYLTQFSTADSFFIAKAKDRREVLEKIADQEFAITLGDKASAARKDAKKRRDALALEESKSDGKLDALRSSIPVIEGLNANWAKAQAEKRAKLTESQKNFDQTKADTCSAIKRKSMGWQAAQAKKKEDLRKQISEIEVESDSAFADGLAFLQEEIDALKEIRCPECGGPTDGAELEALREEMSDLKDARHMNSLLADRKARLEREVSLLDAASDPHLSGLQQAQRQENPYGAQLRDLDAATNPHEAQLAQARKDLETEVKNSLRIGVELAEAETLVSRLNWLYDASFELRGVLMQRAVSRIQDQTNAHLEKHFDAALRIQLAIEGSDKIEVEIYNDGRLSPFRALSGGERCMLKLAFSLSVMKVAQDKSGIIFGQLFLDEPFNGLDEGLKARAFGLLQELSLDYPTVLVVEHSESIKHLFDTKFSVAKMDGHSTIEE